MDVQHTIKGYVRTEEDLGLPGVPVSNGRAVVRTNGDGLYELSCTATDRFILLTLPSGYAPTRRFYIDLHRETGRDFILKSDPASAASEFSFVHITDMHTSTERRVLASDLAADLEQIIHEVGDRIHFIVASGDLTAGGQREEYSEYLAGLAPAECPVYHVAGNHDDEAEVQGAHFMDHLGPLHYSFDHGPVHFAVYDGEAHLRDGTPSSTAPFAYSPSPQDTWLRADFAAQHPSRPIILINHFPWGEEFYAQWHDFPLAATLSGHWHSSRRVTDGKTIHYTTPSLSFAGIDQSPRAYRLCTWSAGQLHSETHALVSHNVFPGISFRPHPDNTAGRIDRYSGHAAGSPLQLRWRAGTGGSIHLAAPLLAEGRIFQAIKNEDRIAGNGLVALDALNGELQWLGPTDAAIKNAPACAAGRIFTSTVTGQIAAFSTATGEVLWNYQLGDPSQRWVYSGPLATDERLYAGVSSHLVALDPASGAVIWRRDDLGPNDWLSSYPSPAAHDRYLAVAFYTQPISLAVLDAATGTTLWHKEGDKAHYIYATPIIDPNGTLYALSGSAIRAYRLDDGELCWERTIPLQRIQATPALAAGRLFVATGTGTLHALNATDGTEIWRWQLDSANPLFTPYLRRGPTTLGAPIAAGDQVYLGGADGCLYALDAATGDCRCRLDLGVPLAAAPVVSAGHIWIGGSDGFVYALAIGN